MIRSRISLRYRSVSTRSRGTGRSAAMTSSPRTLDRAEADHEPRLFIAA